MITCEKCHKSKPESEFYYRQSGKRAGKITRYTCKDCVSEHDSEKARKLYAERRLTILKHYSGDPPKCACCGETTIEFLTIDHINGGGNEHRNKVGENLVRWLILNHLPDGFRILCANCNLSYGTYNYCPHNKA